MSDVNDLIACLEIRKSYTQHEVRVIVAALSQHKERAAALDATIAVLKAELEVNKEVLAMQGGTISSQCIELAALAEIKRHAQAHKDVVESLHKEIERLDKWVADLQSGMYINCVYCGYRYGPKDEVPCSMADALKQHIETCPKHPMSALKQENADLLFRIKTLDACYQKALKDIVKSSQSLAAAEARERELRGKVERATEYCKDRLGEKVMPDRILELLGGEK